MKPVVLIVGAIVSVGVASFIRNAAASVTGTLQNNSFSYVAGSIEAGTYLAAFGGIFPTWLLLFPIFLGIVQGATVVTAYNYGAANYQRVKESYRITVAMGFVYGLFVYLVVGLGLMRYIIQLFGIAPGNAEYAISLRMASYWMINAPFQGLTLGAILLYQSTNRPLTSLLVSALSGIIVYLPVMYIFRFASNHDVWTFIWTTPVTVIIAAVIASGAAAYTMRYRLGNTKRDIKFREEKAFEQPKV